MIFAAGSLAAAAGVGPLHQNIFRTEGKQHENRY
jgi:hypothetical protein